MLAKNIEHINMPTLRVDTQQVGVRHKRRDLPGRRTRRGHGSGESRRSRWAPVDVPWIVGRSIPSGERRNRFENRFGSDSIFIGFLLFSKGDSICPRWMGSTRWTRRSRQRVLLSPLRPRGSSGRRARIGSSWCGAWVNRRGGAGSAHGSTPVGHGLNGAALDGPDGRDESEQRACARAAGRAQSDWMRGSSTAWSSNSPGRATCGGAPIWHGAGVRG